MKLYKKITIPKDLSPFITYNRKEEAHPSEVDMTSEGIQSIWEGVESYYRTGLQPAIIFCLRRHGKIVLNRSIGHARGNGPDDGEKTPKILATPETPVCLFSASKAVTAILIHILEERKSLNLMDPVSYYLPWFGANHKRNTTIYQLLTHQGGVPIVRQKLNENILFNYDDAVQLICKAMPQSAGGTKTAYHAVTSGYILGEIIRQITGKTVREFLDETIRKPLGFHYFNYGLPEDELENRAFNYATGWQSPVIYPMDQILKQVLGAPLEQCVRISNDTRFMRTIIPAGNIMATANETSQFFQMILNRGSLNGVRCMSPLTVRHAIAAGKVTLDRSMMVPVRYSPGMMMGGRPIGAWGLDTPYAFGHLGFLTIFCWADPQRDISVALLTTGKSLIAGHLELFRLLGSISKHCFKQPGRGKERREYEHVSGRTNLDTNTHLAAHSGEFGRQ